jgi:hypothetical protein
VEAVRGSQRIEGGSMGRRSGSGEGTPLVRGSMRQPWLGWECRPAGGKGCA